MTKRNYVTEDEIEQFSNIQVTDAKEREDSNVPRRGNG